MLETLRALLITAPGIILLTILMGSLSLLTSLWDSRGRAQHWVARQWARMLLGLSGVRVRVEGLEKAEPDKPAVFAGNHLSFIDTPVVLAHLPGQFRFLAKQSLYKVPFIGYHLKRAGHIPVPREDPRASIRALSHAAQVIREQGVAVLVFPEGGRAAGELEEFKEGAAYIAIKAGVPIIPFVIQGTREVLPIGSVIVRPRPVRLVLGDPIPTTGLKLADRARLTLQLREQICRLLAAGGTPGPS